MPPIIETYPAIVILVGDGDCLVYTGVFHQALGWIFTFHPAQITHLAASNLNKDLELHNYSCLIVPHTRVSELSYAPPGYNEYKVSVDFERESIRYLKAQGMQ